MPSYRRGSTYRRGKRGYNKKVKGMQNKGKARYILPRAWPPTEMKCSFVSQVAEKLTGTINTGVPFQYFRFSNVTNGIIDFGFADSGGGDTTSNGSRLVTHAFRNYTDISNHYTYAQILGRTVSIQLIQRQASDAATLTDFNCYVWMSNEESTATELVDNTDPIAHASARSLTTCGTPLNNSGQINETLQAMEMSRRVSKYKSYRKGNTSILELSFWIPYTKTRRQNAKVFNKWDVITGVAGHPGRNNWPVNNTISNGLGLQYGFENQVNVVTVPQNVEESTGVSQSEIFDHIRVTSRFSCIFTDRKVSVS